MRAPTRAYQTGGPCASRERADARRWRRPRPCPNTCKRNRKPKAAQRVASSPALGAAGGRGQDPVADSELPRAVEASDWASGFRRFFRDTDPPHPRTKLQSLPRRKSRPRWKPSGNGMWGWTDAKSVPSPAGRINTAKGKPHERCRDRQDSGQAPASAWHER